MYVYKFIFTRTVLKKIVHNKTKNPHKTNIGKQFQDNKQPFVFVTKHLTLVQLKITSVDGCEGD